MGQNIQIYEKVDEKLTKTFLTKKVFKLQAHSSSVFKFISKSFSEGGNGVRGWGRTY